jgi:hypothetical protein
VIRRSLLTGATALGLAVALAACGGRVVVTPAPASPVTGKIVAIDSAGLTDVKGFTLRTADGREVPFTIGVLENGATFPPGHLAEHMASASDVRVSFRQEGGRLVVYRLEDADAP